MTLIQTEGPIEEVAAAGKIIDADDTTATEAEVLAALITGYTLRTHSDDSVEYF